MAQILAVALHISSRVLRTWLQDHTALLSHTVTSQSCPPKVSPALPFLAPGPLVASKPGHTGSRAQGELGTCSTASRGCLLFSGEAVGCSHGLAGHNQRHCVSPGAGLLMAVLQDTPGQWSCQGPQGPHSPQGPQGPQAQLTRSWAGSRSGCRAVPREHRGSLLQTPCACPGDGCLGQVSAGHKRWRFLGPAANPPSGTAVLHTGLRAGTSRGCWALAAGLSCAKTQRWAQE